jgi:hypothetical protein
VAVGSEWRQEKAKINYKKALKSCQNVNIAITSCFCVIRLALFIVILDERID